MSHITLNTTIHEIFHHPEIGALNQYLIYCLDRDLWLNEHVNAIMDQPLTAAKEINWLPEGIKRGMNFLLDELEQDRVRQHFIYSEEEAQEDPQKKEICLLEFQPEKLHPEKPVIVLASGGGYNSVCNIAESFPTASHFVEKGYSVFALSYRVSCPKTMIVALEDLKKAVRWLFQNDTKLGYDLKQYGYVVGGYSAGGNLVCNYGATNIGWKAADLPKPICLFPIYPFIDLFAWGDRPEGEAEFLIRRLGENYKDLQHQYNVAEHVDSDYPPCYIACGRDDATVGIRDSELLKTLLDQAGVPAVLDAADHAAHGFGDGTGTELEGWPERALVFLEQNNRSEF